MDAISENDVSFLTKNGINITGIGKFICSSCNCPISGLKNVKHHIEGYLHQHILLYKMKTTENPRPCKETPQVRGVGVSQANAQSGKELPKAQNNSANKKEKLLTRLENDPPVLTVLGEKNLFTCAMCQIECNSKAELQHHFNGMMHHSNVAAQKNFAKMRREMKASQTKNQIINNQNGNSKSQPVKTPGNIQPQSQSQPQPVNKQKKNSPAKKATSKVQTRVEGQGKDGLKVATPMEALKQSNQLQNGVKKQDTKNQTKNQITNNQNGNSKSQPAKTPLTFVPTYQANQTVPLLTSQIQPQLQPQPLNQQKKNHQNTTVMKPEESNFSQIQNSVKKQETKNQTKPEENPLLKQIDQITEKKIEENLLFLYDILFLRSGSLNIFHPMEVQKLMETIKVTFVRNDKINCVICAEQMENDANKLYDHVRSSEHEDKMETILENHEHFVDFPDQFSDLRLANELMCEVSDSEIDCFVCAIKLPNDDAKVDHHVKLAKHKTTRATMLQTIMDLGQRLVSSNVQDNWYNIENYACEICGKMFVSEIKFFNHITSSNHKDKFQAKAKCYFDFCVPCSYLCFGEEHFNEKHSQSPRHEFHLRSEKYMVPEMPARARKALEDVEGFVETLVKFIDSDNLDIAKLALSDLCESQKNGGLPVSEIELVQVTCCLDYTLVAKNKGNFEENLKLVDTLCKTRMWQQLSYQKETQSVTMFNTKYAFKCQIIFDSNLLVATRYLWCYLNMFKSCKPVILFLQNWLTYCNFDSSQISFFVLAWFVIFYYQNVHNYPSLREVIFPSDCLKNSKISLTSSESSLREDLKGFFEFYSTFDFKTLILSPLSGKVFNKRYYFNSKQNEIWRSVLSVPVVLENPTVQGQMLNVTQNMSKLTLRSFRHYCAESVKLLT